MGIFLQVLYTILVFGAMILIHEFGHFVTARIFKVQINEFSIGMGPKLISIKNGKLSWMFSKKTENDENDGHTAYSIRILPIGGYVSMEGEDGENTNPNAFTNKKAWQRLIIAVAGGFMNIVLAIVLTLIIVLNTNLPSTTIDAFQDNAMSNKTGLEVNDRLVSINGYAINNAADFSYAFQSSMNLSEVDVAVVRDGKEIIIENVSFSQYYLDGETVTETSDAEREAEGRSTEKMMSNDFYVYALPKTFSIVVSQTFGRTVSYIKSMYMTIYDLITGNLSTQYISGVVGTSTVIKKVADEGILSVFYLVALLSTNLAVVNLLPLPALDGGRSLFILIEMIFRRRINKKFETAVNTIGMGLLLLLMLVITFKDIFFPIY